MDDYTVVTDLFRLEHEKQKKDEGRERQGAENLRLSLQNILNSKDGMTFLYWLLNQTGVFSSSFTGNSSTFFLEGKRAVGIAVYRLLMATDPYALQKIITFKRDEAQYGNGDTRHRDS